LATLSYVKFFDFVEAMGLGEHNLNTGVLKVYLTNAAPSQADDADKADLAEITAENGYPSGGTDIQNVWAEAAGTGTLTGTDVVFTATAGGFGPFRYAVIYNDTHATDGLVCYWDYGSSISAAENETVTVDFGASILTIA